MFIWIILSIITITRGYELDMHSCDPVEDRLKFEITELSCNLEKNGLFTFRSERPQLQNVRIIKINRVTEHSLVIVVNVGQLQIIRVQSGQCSSIMAPESVTVYVNGNLCSPVTQSVSTPPPPGKQNAS